MKNIIFKCSIFIAICITHGCSNSNQRISKELLVTIESLESSLISSQKSIDEKNELLMTIFENAKARSALRGGSEWYNRSIEIQRISNDFTAKIEAIKKQLVEENGGYDVDDIDSLKPAKPNTVLGQKSYFRKEFGKEGSGLQALIMNTRDSLIEQLKHPAVLTRNPELIDKVINQSAFYAYDFNEVGKNNTLKTLWYHQFSNIPLAGVLALLTKIQNECKIFESVILLELAKSIPNYETITSMIRTSTVKTIVYAEKSCTKIGEVFKAYVHLVAFNSTANPDIYLEDGTKLLVEDGIGKIRIPVTSRGTKTVKGYMVLDTPDGEYNLPFSYDWETCECEE